MAALYLLWNKLGPPPLPQLLAKGKERKDSCRLMREARGTGETGRAEVCPGDLRTQAERPAGGGEGEPHQTLPSPGRALGTSANLQGGIFGRSVNTGEEKFKGTRRPGAGREPERTSETHRLLKRESEATSQADEATSERLSFGTRRGRWLLSSADAPHAARLRTFKMVNFVLCQFHLHL